MLNGRGRYRLRFVKQKVLLLLLFGPLWSIERREQQACVRGLFDLLIHGSVVLMGQGEFEKLK